MEDWDAPDDEHLVLHRRHPTHPDWLVTAAFEIHANTAVLTGLFVRPASDWAPPGGLTHELVRAIKLNDLREQATARLRTPTVAGYLGIDPSRVQKQKHPGRPGRTDLDYARLALKYAQLADGPTPVKVLSEQEHLASATVRSLINEARNRGLLTRSEPGRAGGKLTNKAMWILAAAGEDEAGGA